ncbi:hypothetical protein E1B28_013276 [Marasmius oreades]|uniref:Secreted protein n=1 Tax=Marasmius oreades TaxID=181124 RepID=A0A9P7RQN0_9AGAR|nr:uncharacterized protein E1B28_013276 [Marasmius oreades]KAG7087298.1 hypothetical protein E1B28_013276 [Marasmius oreades]
MRPLSWLSTLALCLAGTSASPAVSSLSTVPDSTISRITMINNSTQDFVRFMFAFVPVGDENDPQVFWSELAELDSKQTETLPLNWPDGVLVRFSVNNGQGAGASGPLFQMLQSSTCTVTYQASVVFSEQLAPQPLIPRFNLQ